MIYYVQVLKVGVQICMFSNRSTPQDRTDRFVLYAHTWFIPFIRPNCFGLSCASLSTSLTNFLIKNFIPKSFLFRNVCLCYVVKVFFYYGYPFHYLSFGLPAIFIKPKDFLVSLDAYIVLRVHKAKFFVSSCQNGSLCSLLFPLYFYSRLMLVRLFVSDLNLFYDPVLTLFGFLVCPSFCWKWKFQLD